MLVQLIDEFVLMLVHARDATGLSARFVCPRVHRRKGLILDAITHVVPNNLTRNLLHAPGPVGQSLAL